MKRSHLLLLPVVFLALLGLLQPGCSLFMPASTKANVPRWMNYTLDPHTRPDPPAQRRLEDLDRQVRDRLGMDQDSTAVGVLDLQHQTLAMLHPDRTDYAASVPKIGILLAYFQLNPEKAVDLDPATKHELGLMIKISSNEMAAKYSQLLGLRRIQEVLNSHQFYDTNHGGGIWVGKHYGKGTERYGDPIGDNSHAANVRQLLRFYLLLEQRRLVSSMASLTMRQIFESPDIQHETNKFVKGLQGRNLSIIRKSGTWENWLHDTAVITGSNRHYILVAMTRHPRGDEYLEQIAPLVDDWMQSPNAAVGQMKK